MEALDGNEWERVRSAFAAVMRDKAFVSEKYELQRICGTLGLSPCLADLEAKLAMHDKMDFMVLLDYIGDLKKEFYTPEPRDIATRAAFQAVGGEEVFGLSPEDARIDTSTLVDMCSTFNVSIDAAELGTAGGGGVGGTGTGSGGAGGGGGGDGADQSSNAPPPPQQQQQSQEPSPPPHHQLSYEQFKLLFPEEEATTPQQKLRLGFDYNALLEKESQRKVSKKMSRKVSRRRSRLTGGSVVGSSHHPATARGDRAPEHGTPHARGAGGGGGLAHTHGHTHAGEASNLIAPEPPSHPQPGQGAGSGEEPSSPGKRRRKKRSAKGRVHCGEHTLDSTMRAFGRTGVYVDVGPQESLPMLPKHAMKTPVPAAPVVSPILARIDARAQSMKSSGGHNSHALHHGGIGVY